MSAQTNKNRVIYCTLEHLIYKDESGQECSCEWENIKMEHPLVSDKQSFWLGVMTMRGISSSNDERRAKQFLSNQSKSSCESLSDLPSTFLAIQKANDLEEVKTLANEGYELSKEWIKDIHCMYDHLAGNKG